MTLAEAAKCAGDLSRVAADREVRDAPSNRAVRALAFPESDRRAPGLERVVVRGGLAPWQLARVVGQIEVRLASRLTNSRLAALVGLSEDYFARAFKVSTGCTPHAYVVARRIRRAKAMMLASNLPLSQIAVATGFSDQSHLSRSFRSHVGAAPASWRRASPRPSSASRLTQTVIATALSSSVFWMTTADAGPPSIVLPGASAFPDPSARLARRDF